MTERMLDVWCFDERAGVLADAADALQFTYSPGWLDGERPPLSQSLPLDGSFAPGAVDAFFGGLLPEGTPRDVLARRLGVSPENDFEILAAIGGDTAGAVSLEPHGQQPAATDHDIDWLYEDDLVKLIDELPTRPMHIDEEGEFRLSLAGVQDKLPVVVGEDGRVGLTTGQTPSTHILKTQIERLQGTVINEAFCLAIGRAIGVDVVDATPRRVDGREFLLVERYDRRSEADGVRRLHQEDFCQALGIPARRKYQNEGGPSLSDCFALLRRATAVPAAEVLKLVDDVALSFLVGNNDAHGKNYSLLYLPESSEVTLAPAYDIISTAVYNKTHDLTRKMAMSVGGEYRPEYVHRRHLDRLLEEAGLGAAATRRRLHSLAGSAPTMARAVRDGFATEKWNTPLLDQVVAIVDSRSAWLTDLTAPAATPGARRS